MRTTGGMTYPTMTTIEVFQKRVDDLTAEWRSLDYTMRHTPVGPGYEDKKAALKKERDEVGRKKQKAIRTLWFALDKQLAEGKTKRFAFGAGQLIGEQYAQEVYNTWLQQGREMDVGLAVHEARMNAEEDGQIWNSYYEEGFRKKWAQLVGRSGFSQGKTKRFGGRFGKKWDENKDSYVQVRPTFSGGWTWDHKHRGGSLIQRGPEFKTPEEAEAQAKLVLERRHGDFLSQGKTKRFGGRTAGPSEWHQIGAEFAEDYSRYFRKGKAFPSSSSQAWEEFKRHPEAPDLAPGLSFEDRKAAEWFKQGFEAGAKGHYSQGKTKRFGGYVDPVSIAQGQLDSYQAGAAAAMAGDDLEEAIAITATKLGRRWNRQEFEQGYKEESQYMGKFSDDDDDDDDDENENIELFKAPPGREDQVLDLKKTGVDNPYAVAWASYNNGKQASEEVIKLW